MDDAELDAMRTRAPHARIQSHTYMYGQPYAYEARDAMGGNGQGAEDILVGERTSMGKMEYMDEAMAMAWGEPSSPVQAAGWPHGLGDVSATAHHLELDCVGTQDTVPTPAHAIFYVEDWDPDAGPTNGTADGTVYAVRSRHASLGVYLTRRVFFRISSAASAHQLTQS